MSNAHELFNLANSLAKFVEDSEKISLPLFTVKLSQAQNSYPGDHTIGMISRVINKMSSSDKLFISRAEIKDLYEKFYIRNNKFAEVFNEELGVSTEVVEPVKVNNNIVNEDIMQQAFENVVDPVLASALDKAFGGNKVKEYDSSLAKQASSICISKFKDIGFNVKSEVICGRDNVLVCNVAFETPRGSTSVLVPVEIERNRIAYSPSVFIGNTGSHDINKESIFKYLTTKAGDKLVIKAEEVLHAVLIAKNADQEISDVDLALTKFNVQKESKADYLGSQILGVEIEQSNPNLIMDIPQIKDPEIESIAKTFDSELGFASFKFGSPAIEKGRRLVAGQLENCGINTYNIAVSSCDDNSIMYSVAANGGTVAFKVPVSIENNNIFSPSILICNGSVKSFDKSSISSLLRSEGFDRVAALSASPMYGIKPSELVNIVRTAVAEGNYIKAEDALNVLSDSEDEKAYEVALAAFTQGLKTQNMEINEPISKCSMIIKSKNSQHDICGHTGLPLHKVFQDKHNQCQPAYRKGMADSYEGVNFMNSKVYL